MESVESRWATFAGGLVLGTALAAGGTYLAYKYAPVLFELEPSNEKHAKRRNGRRVAPLRVLCQLPRPVQRHLGF